MSKRKSTSDAPPVRCKVEVRHDFTNDEWKDKTDVLTRRMKECELKEEAIKAQAATEKARLKQMKAEVNDLANDLRNGYAMVQVDATVEMNRKKGVKKYYRFNPGKPDNGSFIKEEAMSEEDYQELPLSGDQEQPKPGEPAPAQTTPLQAEPVAGTEEEPGTGDEDEPPHVQAATPEQLAESKAGAE